MDRAFLESSLRKTLDDHQLSRGERRALREVFQEDSLDERELALLLSSAFEMGREELRGHENRVVLDWLEEVVKVIRAAGEPRLSSVAAEAHFAPGDDCSTTIARLFQHARGSVDICVFTITDDRVADAILAAHARRLTIRIVTDDDKVFDAGSDIRRLSAAGIPVRIDSGESLMHHKFAVFDQRTLLTGSYNWTLSAARYNDENLITTDDPRLVSAFSETFEKLWRRYG